MQGAACEASYEVAFLQGICEGVNRVLRWEASHQPETVSLFQWQAQKRGTITDSQVLMRVWNSTMRLIVPPTPTCVSHVYTAGKTLTSSPPSLPTYLVIFKVKAIAPEALGALMKDQKKQSGHVYLDLAFSMDNGCEINSLVEMKRM